MTRRPASPTPNKPKTLVMPQHERPSRQVLGWLAAAVLALHLALLWGMTGSLDWRLPTDDAVRVAPLQTRWIPPVSVPVASPTLAKDAQPRTRIATVPKAPPEPVLAPMPESPPASSDASFVESPAQAASETNTPTQAAVDTTAEAPKIETITATEPTPSSAAPPKPSTPPTPHCPQYPWALYRPRCYSTTN